MAERGVTGELDREALGRLVRDEWILWARHQPDPKPSWLLPWEELTEPEREVDRRIGERLAEVGAAEIRAKLKSTESERNAWRTSNNRWEELATEHAVERDALHHALAEALPELEGLLEHAVETDLFDVEDTERLRGRIWRIRSALAKGQGRNMTSEELSELEELQSHIGDGSLSDYGNHRRLVLLMRHAPSLIAAARNEARLAALIPTCERGPKACDAEIAELRTQLATVTRERDEQQLQIQTVRGLLVNCRLSPELNEIASAALRASAVAEELEDLRALLREALPCVNASIGLYNDSAQVAKRIRSALAKGGVDAI